MTRGVLLGKEQFLEEGFDGGGILLKACKLRWHWILCIAQAIASVILLVGCFTGQRS